MTAFRLRKRLGSRLGSKAGMKVLAAVLAAVLALSLGGGRVVVAGGHHPSGSTSSGGSWLDALGRLVGLGPHAGPRPQVQPRQLPEGAVPRVDALPAAKKWPAAKRVKELPAQRTANARFYKLSDGRVQADVSAAPVNYRDASGIFKPIDTTVRPLSTDGFAAGNTTNTFGTFFGDRSDRLVRVRDGERWVDIGLAGPARTLTPKVTGSRVTYANVLDGADLVFDLTSTGLKNSLVLNHPVGSGFTAAFTLSARGVVAVSNKDGSVSLVTENAAPLMTIPAPFMFDSSSGASSLAGEGFSAKVSQHLSGSTLTLTADAAWLADAKRHYPVIIDPSINIQPVPADGQDVEIYSGSAGTNYNNTYQLKVGTDASASWRSLVQFPLTGIPAGTSIDDATLSMYYDQTQYTYAYDVAMEARPITAAWSESTATWTSTNANIAPVPAGNVVQVDDSDTGKVAVKGTWPASTNTTLTPLAVNSTYHYNSDTTTGDTFTWVPTLTQNGNYQVEVHYVSESDRPTNAPYTVFYNGGSKTVNVDQTGSAAGVWKTLGTFPFVAGTAGKVVLGDVAGKSAIADAVRFTRSGVDTKRNAVSSVWNNFSVRDAVQSWINNPASNHGLMVKAVDEGTKGRGGPVYEASEYFYQNGARDYNLPKLTVTFGRPGVTVAQPSTITSTGAVLSWSSYVDPSSAAGDNIVEYQVHRSVHQQFTPSAATLVAPLASTTTGYQDTSGRPTAADTPDSQLGQYYYYMVVVKTADGQLIPSSTVGVRLPKAGHITQVYRTGTVDATLSKTLPTTNVDVYDGDPYVSAGNNSSLYGVTRGLVKFPTPTGIPTGAQITGAQLRMWTTYDYGAFDGFVDVHKLNTPFNETGATWSQAASGTAWKTPGGDFDATPLSTVGGSSAGITNDPEWENWDVTSAVKSWVAAPSTNDGLLLKMHDETAATQRAMFLSSEGQEPMLRPTLEVTYLEQSAEAAYYAPDTPTVMKASTAYTVPVTVSNPTLATLGTGDWELGYQWETTDGQPVTDPTGGTKTALPANVAPGASIDINAQLTTPPPSADGDTRTDYTLKWALHNKTTNQWMYQVTPAIQTLDQQVAVQEPTSDQLGMEKFYDYTGIDTGAGSSLVNNLHAGNTVWSYNAFDNPSRGPSTSVAMSYNSLDTSDTVSGSGWSMQAASLIRLGAPLDFHPNPNPTTVTLTDSDGTSSTFSWDATAKAWKSPAGVHLYLQNLVDCGPKTEESRAWVMTRPDRTQFYFDCNGYPSSIVDRNGNMMSFTYEVRRSQNKPVEFLRYITDAAGRRTLTIDYWAKDDTYNYIDDNTWAKVTGQSKLTNSFIIDHVKQVTDISGRTLTFTYTLKGLLGEMVDGAGSAQPKVFRFQYDMTQGNKNVKLIKVTDPRGHDTNLTYYSRPEDDPEFKWWTKTYTDRLGHPTTYFYADPDGPQGDVIDTQVNDAENHNTTDVTDGFGRVIQTVNAKNESTTFHYDADHNMDRQVEPNGAVSTSTFDPNTGYPIEVKDAEANKNGWAGTIYTYQTGLGGHIADPIGISTQEGQVRPDGRLWTFGHDTAGNVVSITDPDGNATGEFPNDYVTVYSYDILGQLRSVTDANGHTTKYDDYDASGTAKTITDARNDPPTTYTYDLRGNVLTVTDALQHTSSYTYDTFGRQGDASLGAAGFVSKIPKDQASGQFIITPAPAYDANDNVTVSTAPDGAQTTNSYDNADQLSASLAPRDTATGPERKTSFTYDKVGNVLSVTEPNGNVTPSDPNDFVTRYTYDAVYQNVTMTDARGGLTTYSYDNVGNLTKTVDPNKSATADPDDFTTKVSYDLNHQARTTTDASGFTASVDYDRDGLVIDTVDEEGNKTLLSYDARGMLTQSKAPHDTVGGVIDYHTTQYVYDQVGNRTRVVSPRGVETPNDDFDFTQFTDYDEMNRVKEQTLPYSAADPFVNQPTDTIINTYDVVGNLSQVSRPPSGSKIGGVDFSHTRVDTTYSYFDNSWMKTSKDPFGVVDTYDYDALGDQSIHTTASNDGALTRNISWTYYPDGKLQTKDDEGFPANFTPDTEFHNYAYTYDPNGNMTDLHDNSDIANVPEWQMTYNQVNQVATLKAIVAEGEGANHNATYDYYPNGTLKQRTYDGAYDNFEYDPVDRVNKVTSGLSPGDLEPQQTTYKYTPRGQVDVETRGLGNTVENTYYADGLLKHRILKGGALDQSTVAEHTLTYDANGNALTDQARLMNADNNDAMLSRNKVYTYDPRDRVARVDDGTTIEGYSYDADNNVLGEDLTNATVPGDELVTNAYDRNRLVQSQDQKPDESSKSTFTYDTLSRLKTIKSDATVKGTGISGTTTYTYDGFSRKQIVQQDPGGGAPTQTIEYQWDSLDRLRQAFALADDPSQGGLTKENKVFYTYLGASNLVLNEDRKELDTSGQITDEQTTSYRYGLDGTRLSQDTSDTATGEAQYNYSIDPRGNVEALTYPSGQTAATYGYTAHGHDITALYTGVDKPNSDPNAPPKTPVNVYRFAAQQFDPQSGNYNVGFRDYSPSVSNFLTPDNSSDPQADLRLGPVSVQMPAPQSPSIWDWLKAQGKAFIDDIKNDPLEFVGELAIGAAAALAVGLICSTGVGCVILAGIAAGAAAAAYGYGVDTLQGEHGWDTGDFIKTTAIGAVVGGVTAGVGYGIGRGISMLVSRAVGTAVSEGAAEGEAALLRSNTPRQGGFGKKLPMNMDVVRRVAAKYRIPIDDVKYSIDKVKVREGSTAPNQRVTLSRGAFVNEEQLAKTLIHELVHVRDLRRGRPYPATYDAASADEIRAEGIANRWWEIFGKYYQ